MPSSDDSQSLWADVVRRWKDELYSADTFVALGAVLVAIPAGLLAGMLVAPLAIYPVWFAAAVAPRLSLWGEFYLDVEARTALGLGAGMAAVIAVVTAGVFAAAGVADLDGDVRLGAAAVLGLLFGALLNRMAFHRLAGGGK